MRITFNEIKVGCTYSRPSLAETWGYTGFQAISRGVVTPRGENKIILFVTEQKQASAEQYRDRLSGGMLDWEGPTDHFAEERIVNADKTGDEIHLFHRVKHHTDFTYCGKLRLLNCTLHSDQPSAFTFRTLP